MTRPNLTLAITEHNAAAFNARFPVGSAVMFIPAVGATPVHAYTASVAFATQHGALVHLRGYRLAVDADRCYAPLAQRCPERALPMWQWATAFVVGFAAAVLLGVLGPTARAVPQPVPEAVMGMDCDAPADADDAPPVYQDGRAQA